jgi:hypothetical protein
MKAKLAVLSLMAAASTIPANAAAAPPQRDPVPGGVITEPAGAVCDFPIAITPLKLREKVTSFSDGRVRLTGVAIVEVSNVDNGRSIVINSSGPGWLDRNNVQGGQLFFLFPSDVGGPGIYLYRGNVTFTRDDAGNFTSITATGTRSGNLCAAIT